MSTHHPMPSPFDATASMARLRDSHARGKARPLDFRRRQLAGIATFLREREAECAAALKDDLGKPFAEAYAAEIAYPAREARLALKMLGKWTKPERVPTPLFAWPGKC